MTFRRATVHDISELVALDTVVAHESDRIDQIKAWVADGTCHLIDEGGIRAYGVLHRHFHHQPFIEMLMIDPRHRRRGLGRAILQELCGLYPAEAIWTSTNQSNMPMQNLLAQFGFKRHGQIDIDAGDPELYFRFEQR